MLGQQHDYSKVIAWQKTLFAFANRYKQLLFQKN